MKHSLTETFRICKFKPALTDAGDCTITQATGRCRITVYLLSA
jgi:hypothetical protein